TGVLTDAVIIVRPPPQRHHRCMRDEHAVGTRSDPPLQVFHGEGYFMTSHRHVLALIVACTTTLVGAQGPSSETAAPTQGLKIPAKSLRLVGCVQTTETSDKRLA